MTKTWIKRLFTFALALCAGLAYAAEPWAMWSNFSGLTGAKSPDISSTQNGFDGSAFTFHIGSGYVNEDGSLTTTGGASTEAPYIDFNRGDIDIGYDVNPITIVMTLEMPETLPVSDGATDVKPLFFAGSDTPSGIGLTITSMSEEGTTFGGAWQNNMTWSGSDTSKLISSSVTPKQLVTFVASISSAGLGLKLLGAEASLGTIASLKAGSSVSATRVTFGNSHNSGSNTMSYRLVKVAVFRGTGIADSEIEQYFAKKIEIATSTSVSAINAQIAELAADSMTTINLVTTGDTTIVVDTTFTESNKIVFTGDGKLTLQADAAVDFSEMANVDFISYSGPVQRSWLTPGVIGFNFNGSGVRNASSDTLNCVDTALALESGEWLHDTSRASGSTNLFSDGISTLTWSANNVYTEANDVTGGTFIQGYLDDGRSGASISLTGVPYDEYDVIIYCSTDDASKKFKAKTVNGTVYTWDSSSGAAVTTNNVLASWGSAAAAAGKAVYGVNTLRVNNLTGPLTILGGTNSDGARGCISAIQIMPSGTSTAPTLSVGTEGTAASVNWTDGNWNVSTAPESGAVNINVTGDVTLTVDIETELTAVMVEGTGSLTLKTAEGGALKADSLSATVPVMIVDAGVDISTTAAATTYLYKTDSMSTSVLGNTYTAGVGSVDSAVSIALDVNGGTAILKGDENPENSVPYYISPSCNATQSTIVFTNAVAIYPTALSIGTANYIVSGLSDITCYTNTHDHGFYLCDGGAGRTSTFLLKDSAVVKVYGVNNVDSNRGVVLFGHWAGTSTFTLQDTAQFIAEGEVLVGKTGGTHTININGGTFTAQGIKLSGAAGGVNTMNLSGGVLALGDIGLTSYNASRTMTVNVRNEAVISATSNTLPITQKINLAENSTLTLRKDESVDSATITASGEISGSGGLVVDGVTLDLVNASVSNYTGVITVKNNGSVIVPAGLESNVAFDGTTTAPSVSIVLSQDHWFSGYEALVAENVTVHFYYDGSEITSGVEGNVYTPVINIWRDGSWSWTLKEGEDVLIYVDGEDETMTHNGGDITLGTVKVIGEGSLVISGSSKLVAGNGLVVNANVQVPIEMISASSAIEIAEGVTLSLSSETEITDPDSHGTRNSSLTLPPVSGSGTLRKVGSGSIAVLRLALEAAVVIAEGDIHLRDTIPTAFDITAENGTFLHLSAWNCSFGNNANKITLKGGSGLVLSNGASGGETLGGTITIADAAEVPAKIYGSAFTQVTITAAINGAGKLEFAEGEAFGINSDGSEKYPCHNLVTVSGVISDSVEVIVSEKSNEVKFTGNNTYTGNTLISEGSTLRRTGFGSLGTVATVNGTLVLEDVSLSAKVTGCGVVTNTAGSVTFGGSIIPSKNGCLTVQTAIAGTPKFDVSALLGDGVRFNLLKVSAAENLPDKFSDSNFDGGVPKGWIVVPTDDGLGWALKRKKFYIRIR